MQTHSGRLRTIRMLALLLTVLSFLIIFVSAYLRLDGAGLGCAAWPDCYGQLLSGGAHPHSGPIRLLHRVTGALSLLLAFLAAWYCIRPKPIEPLARYATLLLGLMILLTFIGLWSPEPRRAWTGFLNILGGLGLVALSMRLVLAATDSPPQRVAAWLPVCGLAALLLASALGALIGARYAAISCASTPACGAVWWPAAEGWAALNPFVTITAPASPGDAGGVALHLLHRYCSAATMLLLGLAGLRALAGDATRSAGRWLLALLVLEFSLGGLTVVSGFSLVLALGHSVLAAALVAAAMQLVSVVRANPRGEA